MLSAASAPISRPRPAPRCRAPQAWSLLSIFVSTILGLVLDPLPVGAWAFIAVTVAVATKTLTFAEAFAATNNEIIWLIVVSFFFAKVGCGVGAVGEYCLGVVPTAGSHYDGATSKDVRRTGSVQIMASSLQRVSGKGWQPREDARHPRKGARKLTVLHLHAPRVA